MLVVLRLGHRHGRDERLSTHIGLAARALGADEIVYSGEEDRGLLESISNVSMRWGGRFKASYNPNWRKVIETYRKKKFCMVHLSMYGLPLQKKIKTIRKARHVLVIAGSEKVPYEIYQLATCNIAVTSQPHSEAAALAIFLHEYYKGKELEKSFPGAKLRIVPQERGKKVLDTSNRQRR